MEAEEREKRGRPGLIHHLSDVRWTRGGHENDVNDIMGRGPTELFRVRICLEPGSTRLNLPIGWWYGVLTLDLLYKSSLARIRTHSNGFYWALYIFVVDPSPYVILTWWMRPGLPRFFVLFRFCVLYWPQTKEHKTGEVWERGYKQCTRLFFSHAQEPGNKATDHVFKPFSLL